MEEKKEKIYRKHSSEGHVGILPPSQTLEFLNQLPSASFDPDQ